MIVLIWLTFFFFWVFVLGCAIGSFLNVVIYRLPRGKNLFWPSSRCGACLKPIPSADNVPLWSYLRLRGRCRKCGATFSMRYFWVELLTGVIFVVLYAVEIGWNIHGIAGWREGGFWYLSWGGFAPSSWPYFLAHAVLASLLIAALACLLDTGRIPHSLGVTGAIVGLGWNLLYPWPAPSLEPVPGGTGFIPCPVWEPLPAWLPPGSVFLGLLTGLAGILVGPAILRLTNALIRVHWHVVTRGSVAIEHLSPASATLVLLTGGFLGWQPTVVAIALAIAFVWPILYLDQSPDRAFPLGLVVALLIVWFGWRWLGPLPRRLLHEPTRAALVLLLLYVALGLIRPARFLWIGSKIHRVSE